jgi:sortase (surface protein transpeptidase)
VRITGRYPPPLAPPPGPPSLADVDIVALGYPKVARYDRSRSHRPRSHRPYAAKAWTGLSAALAVAGTAAIVLAPQPPRYAARVDGPVAPVTVFATATPSISDAAPPPVLQLAESAPVRLQIPALGVASPVMQLGLRRDGSLEVPPGAYPVGWYDGSPTPGELGPAVLAGHVDWGGEPGAFYGLRELLPGDQVVIERADGSVATFVADRVEEYGKDDFPADEVYGDLPYAGLRLITCGGSFDEDAGDYQDNVIVFARLVTTS